MPYRIALLLFLAAVTCFVLPSLGAAAPGDLLQTFVEPSPSPFSRFAESVVAVGNDVLVGGELSHKAYLFNGSSGAVLHTFVSPFVTPDDGFGFCSAATNGTIAIAAPIDSVGANRSGAVYLYDSATGSLLNTLKAPTPTDEGEFGFSLAAQGNKLLVGNRKSRTPVFLFDTAGNRLLTIPDPSGNLDVMFGQSVAFVGNNILIGAPGRDNNTAAGAAYLYNGTTGQLLRTFHDPVSKIGDEFGLSVAAMGSNILIGAPQDTAKGINAGAAFMYDSVTGNLLQSFFNPTNGGNRFGQQLGAVGGNFLISAENYQTANDGGAFFVFAPSAGNVLLTVRNPHPGASSGFGIGQTPIAGVGNNYAIGAWNAGAAYLFQGVAVPEPPGFVLAAFGFSGVVALAGRARRRGTVTLARWRKVTDGREQISTL